MFARDGLPILGRHDTDWLPREMSEKVSEHDRNVLETNRQIQTIEVLPGDQAGSDQTWYVIKFPVADLAGSKFIAGVAVNVSDIKKAQLEIASLNERLNLRVIDLELMTAKLEAARDEAMRASSLKSQFIANMSHEIRTPMSGVMGMSELLLENDLNDETRELATYMNNSAKSLMSVLNDLLDFSKLEAGKVELESTPFSIRDLVEDVITSNMAAAQKKELTVQSAIDEAIPDVVIGDSGRIRQVLLNLVHNAVKFTKDGSITISIDVRRSDADSQLVGFSVKDTGIGINSEAQKHLFEPFVQADGSTTRKYGGTGLGLSICKSLVELMSGRIGIASSAGKGSTFWFELPLKRATGEQQAAA